MTIMQKILVSLICTLALLALLMPATVAEDSQNATANTTLNVTENATASIMLNVTSNLTGILTPSANSDATTTAPSDNSRESAPAATQLGSGNAANHTKVLRAGFEKTKPLNNLDVYGNKSTYNIPFNASSRLGNVSQFTYKTDYKPLYNISQYSRTKPLYEVPGTLSSKPVYSTSGYPDIKTANSIP
jgi:hypothetical protein